MRTFVPGGAFQSSRPESTQQRRYTGEYREWRPRRRRRRRRRIRPANPAAHYSSRQGHQQAIWHHTVRHRQIQPNRVPSVLRLLQPYVLDYLPPHFRRGSRRSSAFRRGQIDSVASLVQNVFPKKYEVLLRRIYLMFEQKISYAPVAKVNDILTQKVSRATLLCNSVLHNRNNKGRYLMQKKLCFNKID